jgi:hypothetical protein
MSTALTKTSPDKYQARTLRRLRADLARAIDSARSFLLNPDLTEDQVEQALASYSVSRPSQRTAAHLGEGIRHLRAMIAWAEQPGHLMLRADELAPGDRTGGMTFPDGGTRAVQVDPSVVAELRDGERIIWEDGQNSYTKPSDTFIVERV